MTGRVRGRRWLAEHVADAYVKRAKSEGMRSRAAYKLAQIVERDRLLAPGMVVVDLGAAPGSWSQVVARRIAPHGQVLALDRLEMSAISGVTCIQGDVREPAVLDALERALTGRSVDLVLSDLAPNLTGIRATDQARALELMELARDFALKHLKPRGNLLVKAFHGTGYDGFVKSLRAVFEEVATRKPEASRARSSEVYLLGRGLKTGRGAGGGRSG